MLFKGEWYEKKITFCELERAEERAVTQLPKAKKIT
jgi:hypothetical protein